MAQLLSTTVTGNLNISSILTSGISGNVNVQSIASYTAQFNANANTFTQFSIQNQNSGTDASSDIVAHADDGSDTNYFIDFGINSSTYSNSSYTLFKKHDAYLYNAGGNLVIGTSNTGLANDVIFFANGTLSSNESMRIYGANLNINITRNLSAGNISTTGNITAGNVSITQNVSSGNLTVTQNATTGNITVTSNISSGNISTNGLLINGVTSPAFPFTFGGTGTPTTGTDKTPWLRVPYAATCIAASLTAKTAPSGGSFVAAILKSSDGGATFPTTITTLTMTTGTKVITTTPTTALVAGDFLRFDITSVNGAADWTCQLNTKL